MIKTSTKKSGETHTLCQIRRLSHEERVTEIAKMLSGDQLSEVAMENARILLS